MAPTSTLPDVGVDRPRALAERRGAPRTYGTAGAALVVAVALGAAYLRAHGGPTFLDRMAADVVPARHQAPVLAAVTRLGSPPVVGLGAVAGFLGALWRDRARAVAALLGPAVAVGLCDAVVKPLVDRPFDGVVSFPSGTVAAVAALAAVAVLVAPTRWRLLAVTGGVLASAAMALSVVALRWHYPTDALGGAALGVGVVLVTDALCHRAAGRPAGSDGGGRGRDPRASAPAAEVAWKAALPHHQPR